MSAEDSSDRVAPPPGTARDGTRVEEAAPEAMRLPPRDTDPVEGPPDESGVSTRGERGAGEAPRSDVPTPRNAEPVVSERSAPTVRRADRASRPSRGRPRRPSQPQPASDGSEDTLLSAPAPADHFEVDVDRRLEESERRLDQLEGELARLAARPAPVDRSLAETPLFWMVFLLAVAVAWLFFHGAH